MVIVELSVILILKWAFDYHAISKSVANADVWEQFKVTAIMDFQRTILYIFYSSVLWSAFNLGKWQRDAAEALLKSALSEKASSDLQYQFSQAQNAFLKEQINPHLLFNTLNAIYSTVYRHSPKDSEAILLLSEIMRYSYEEPDHQGLVPLESEIYQLKNLIKLNTYRFRDTARIDLQLTGHVKDLRIIPLVLLTLSENMFKHGDLQHCPGSIDIGINENGHLTFISKNIRKLRGQTDANSNVGLNNTRLRLDYAYPGNYNLSIVQTEEMFTVNLLINLAYERSDHR
ncbi:LytS/YehU family sensor histidine kinase [Mucilaginibacter rubeus]|uniref:sensor histidine kinase n=1 Tax=Mucilaginibacter rubeus TaxID=2027860 RepID=UPI00339A6E79